jgi:hypothetical protein
MAHSGCALGDLILMNRSPGLELVSSRFPAQKNLYTQYNDFALVIFVKSLISKFGWPYSLSTRRLMVASQRFDHCSWALKIIYFAQSALIHTCSGACGYAILE